MLNYAVHAENGSLYNTPPAFAVYALGLVMKWLIAPGRPRRRSPQVNERKAAKLYAEIDRTGFYRGTAHKDCRSLMNVTFRLATEELEKQFVKESTAAGLDGLKGHRSVGGMRASIYNAFPGGRASTRWSPSCGSSSGSTGRQRQCSVRDVSGDAARFRATITLFHVGRPPRSSGPRDSSRVFGG